MRTVGLVVLSGVAVALAAGVLATTSAAQAPKAPAHPDVDWTRVEQVLGGSEQVQPGGVFRIG